MKGYTTFVSIKTRMSMGQNGKIVFSTTAGGHKQYDVSSVQLSRRVYNLPLAIQKTKEPVVAKGGGDLLPGLFLEAERGPPAPDRHPAGPVPKTSRVQ